LVPRVGTLQKLLAKPRKRWISLDGWWAASYIVLWALVVVLCVVVVALARQIGTLHLRLGPRGALEMDDEGPPLGEAPPPIDALAVTGESITIGGPGEAQMLLFVSPGCHVCDRVLPSVPAVASSGHFRPYVVTDVDVFETTRGFDVKNIGALVVPGQNVAATYGVPGTPYVVLLDPSGVVRGKGTVNNLEQVEGLIDTAVRRMSVSQIESHTA
jgi:methylamine dehydrogenase accessory protein MauD